MVPPINDRNAPPSRIDLARMSSSDLLPVVYEELRRLASARLAREQGAEQMQATSLVHAAYLRLIGPVEQSAKAWDSRGHFFAAAALAMRRILVERARQRKQAKRGAGWHRVDSDDLVDPIEGDPVDLEALDSALSELELADQDLYRVVMLRYFGGLSIENTAAALGISGVTVKRRWVVARLWLLERIGSGEAGLETLSE